MMTQLALFEDDTAPKPWQPPVAWQETFERREVTDGNGRTWLGWVCPDCGKAEVNEYVLLINHGWDPDREGHKPIWDGACFQMRRRPLKTRPARAPGRSNTTTNHPPQRKREPQDAKRV